jgi:hypothetical protein
MGKENLIPFEKGKSGNPRGRPPKLFSSIVQGYKEKGYTVPKKGEIEELAAMFLQLTRGELEAIYKDEAAPILARQIASALLKNGKEGWNNIKDVLERVAGKPTQSVNVDTTAEVSQRAFIQILDTGVPFGADPMGLGDEDSEALKNSLDNDISTE